MTNGEPLYASLLARRSAKAKDLIAPGPDSGQIERMVLAASRAPDHGRLVPFRFVMIGEDRRTAFATVLAAAAKQENPGLSASEVDRARDKAFEGPCLIAMIARVDVAHPKIPASDQWLTAGCALENLLLAAQALGFAVAVRSGRYLEMAVVREAFALAPVEHFVCFLAVGTPADYPPAKPKPSLDQVLSRW
ncbi:MAG TPA: nitroreductase [Beijerinckiaceae bacterium]|nr:nitroreductase [Beijerinckiaceae bacterium]